MSKLRWWRHHKFSLKRIILDNEHTLMVNTLERIACNQICLLWLYYNISAVKYNPDNPKRHAITKFLSTKMCSSCKRLTCNQDNFVFLIFSFQNTNDRFAREYENKKMTKNLKKRTNRKLFPLQTGRKKTA